MNHVTPREILSLSSAVMLVDQIQAQNVICFSLHVLAKVTLCEIF